MSRAVRGVLAVQAEASDTFAAVRRHCSCSRRRAGTACGAVPAVAPGPLRRGCRRRQRRRSCGRTASGCAGASRYCLRALAHWRSISTRLPLVENLPAPTHFAVPRSAPGRGGCCRSRYSRGEVQAALRSGGGELLEDIRLFDVFEGEQVGEGRKSLAFALRFRGVDRTLTEDEASAARDAAVAAASAAVGAELRS